MCMFVCVLFFLLNAQMYHSGNGMCLFPTVFMLQLCCFSVSEADLCTYMFHYLLMNYTFGISGIRLVTLKYLNTWHQLQEQTDMG